MLSKASGNSVCFCLILTDGALKQKVRRQSCIKSKWGEYTVQVETPALEQSGRMPPKRECKTESPVSTGDALSDIYTQSPLTRLAAGEQFSVVTHYLPSMEPTGTHDSSVHGSVPCSSWEIISGLETWSPAQRGEKKESV